MVHELVVVGCGGFGRQIPDIIHAINQIEEQWKFVGFADDGPSDVDKLRVEAIGAKFIGSTVQAIATLRNPYYVVGIANSAVRRRITNQLDSHGWKAATIIHPTAVIGTDTKIDSGSIVSAGAVIDTNIRIGRGVHINKNSTIGHDVVIADFATLSPLVSIGGNCLLEEEAFIGSSATVLPSVRVGAAAKVGAAACVVSNVQPRTVVKGVPAK